MTDPIGTEIIDAAAGGVAKTLRAKVAQTVMRLIAGGPGFKYLDEVRRNENTIEGRRKVDAIVAEEVARQAIADPDYMERAKARFLGEMFQKQENVEAVGRIANEEILQLNESDILSDDDTVPSDDWMNAFTHEAEMATSQDLRERLGKILARETRKPGSFSRATVRLIAELEKETLESFKFYARYGLSDFILKGSDWDQGQKFVECSALQTEGLITGTALTKIKAKVGGNGSYHLADEHTIIGVEGEAGTEFQIPVYLLTRVGKELRMLLDLHADHDLIGFSIEGWEKKGLSKIFSGAPVIVEGERRVSIDHVHYQAPEPQK